MSIDHASWAAYLLAGVDERRELQAITKQVDELSIDDAYAIQAALLELQLGRGDTLAGAKLGLTSVAKQEQMGVSEPVYGWVPASSVLGADGAVVIDELIHPRCEPEIVFVLSEDLAGPGVGRGDVLDATKEVVGGIEVIDSRYEAFSFTLPDVIADNTSAARVAIGSDGADPHAVDLVTTTCAFDIDGDRHGRRRHPGPTVGGRHDGDSTLWRLRLGFDHRPITRTREADRERMQKCHWYRFTWPKGEVPSRRRRSWTP